ncbi:MAG: sulfite exporter TauE/SafE family protein [Rhodothermales bacterium]|nr:sulfite exporter TauE/SafE family protein [Rhodothermales bacterium]
MDMDLSVLDWLLFAVAGIGTGIINTLAGSGSLITLPIFIFLCGLPAPVANGTNRIGVMVQSVVGVIGMRRSGVVDFAGSAWIIIPAVLGAALGSRIAVGIDEQAMSYTIGGLMVFMLIVLLVNPKRWIRTDSLVMSGGRRALAVPVFFLIGVYGGFIQAGVGIFLLAGLVLLSRYTLSAANGIKLVVVAAYGLPTLAIFFLQDQVHLGFGLAMAVFQSIGAWLAVRFVVRVPNADVWIHRLLIVIVAISAVLFFV